MLPRVTVQIKFSYGVTRISIRVRQSSITQGLSSSLGLHPGNKEMKKQGCGARKRKKERRSNRETERERQTERDEREGSL